GAGNLFLTGTNTFGGPSAGGTTYTGFAKVSGGFLVFNSDANLGFATTPVADPGALRASKIELLVGGGLRLNAGQGAVTINRYVPIQNAGNQRALMDVQTGSTLQFSGTLVGAVNTQTFIKTGAGALIFDANAGPFPGTVQVGDGTNATGTVMVTAGANLTRANVALAAGSNATLDLSGAPLQEF